MEAKDYDGRFSSTHGAHSRPVTLVAQELATLLRLRNVSAKTNAVTPDIIALHEAGLVHIIATENGDAVLALTVDGRVLLQSLGAELAKRPPFPN
jgi:hypothetical protein